MTSLRIPQIADVKTALEIYYGFPYIGNAEIQKLFRCRRGETLSPATVARLKGFVKAKMREDDIPSYNSNTVDVEVAFDVWGLKVKDLELRYKKMEQLNI